MLDFIKKRKELIAAIFVGLFIVGGAFLYYSQSAKATVTSFSMTFAGLSAVDTNGNQHALLSDATTIDLLNLSSGESVSVNSLPAGTYVGLVANITSIKTNGEEILAGLQYSIGEDFSNISIPTIPFTVSGDNPALVLNIYMSSNNFDEQGFPTQPPIFSLYAPNDSSGGSGGATINGSIEGVASASSNIYYGLFTNWETEPIIGGDATNNGNGTASFSIVVPAGTYYLGAFEDVDGSGPETGPNDGDNIFFYAGGGSDPGSIAVATGETQAVTMTKLFEYDGNDKTKKGGGGSGVTGNGSITVAFQASPSIAITKATYLYVGVFTSSPGGPEGQAGGGGGDQGPARVAMVSVPVGTFTSTTAVISKLGNDVYYVGGVLDIGNNFGEGTGPTADDYMGIYGGMSSPVSVEVTASNQNIDISGSPITLEAYGGQ